MIALMINFTIFCNNNNNPAYKYKRFFRYTSFTLHDAALIKSLTFAPV